MNNGHRLIKLGIIGGFIYAISFYVANPVALLGLTLAMLVTMSETVRFRVPETIIFVGALAVLFLPILDTIAVIYLYLCTILLWDMMNE
jgi:hypothetical protein